jgi:ribonuclease HI
MDTLIISAAVASSQGRLAAGVAIRQGQITLHTAARTVDEPRREAAAYRALVYGLRIAHRMGARQIRIVTDEEEIIAQLEGRAGVAPSPSLTGLYLQTRAMLHAFHNVALTAVPRQRNTDAVLAAQSALGLVSDPEDGRLLPLWTAGTVHLTSIATR